MQVDFVRQTVRLSQTLIYSGPEHLGVPCTEYINNKITLWDFTLFAHTDRIFHFIHSKLYAAVVLKLSQQDPRNLTSNQLTQPRNI